GAHHGARPAARGKAPVGPHPAVGKPLSVGRDSGSVGRGLDLESGLTDQSHAVRLGNPGQGVRGGGIALTAVIQRAVWLHIGEWNDGRQPGDLERDQRFDLVPRKGSLDPTEARPIVVAGVGANLHSELATPPSGRDRDRQGPRVDAAGNVGAVDASQDRLVFTGAFADVGVEIQESGLSVWYGRGGVGWRAPVPA